MICFHTPFSLHHFIIIFFFNLTPKSQHPFNIFLPAGNTLTDHTFMKSRFLTSLSITCFH
ncbi:putative signal peptide protein [Puccinia sorghi]|uniref:Putative signal peptide protein n=1 Tax=Puccinia sorghi TaxID=27349 RepID=A0A0L6UEG8_9BASI|nr:putative signal peptide protein [Puccinia sorghi]